MKSVHPTPVQLRALARRDPSLARAIKRVAPYPGFPIAPLRTHYQALARAIVFQQLTGKAAGTIHGRVCDLTPGSGFPHAPEVLALSDEALRGAGLSRAKVASLRDLATRIDDGRLVLRGIGRLTDDEIIERLITVRGIGVWSARMFLLFKLGRLDVLAAGDLGVRKGVQILDELEALPSAAAVEERGQCWRPLASVATWVCWRLTEL